MSQNRRRRVNGFDGSTPEQLMSWAVEAIMIPLFYSLVATTILPTHYQQGIALIVGYSVILVAMFCLWLPLELIDPATEGGCAYPCFKEVQQKVRFDAVSRKRVRGLDHYCKFLNTPIGARNYLMFFILVILGCVQFTFQAITGVVAVSVLLDWSNNMLQVSLWLFSTVAAAGVLYPSFDLLFFHIYLMRRNISTYDYLVEEAKQRNLAKRAKRAEDAKRKEQALNATTEGTDQRVNE